MNLRRKHAGSGAHRLPHAGNVSRRTMVAGTLAATAVTAILPLGDIAHADEPSTDMMAFLLLSEALTGVDRHTLAPELVDDKTGDLLKSDPGIDPINVKDDYFNWLKDQPSASSFGKLLQLTKDNSHSLGDIIPKVNASADDMKFLARSIVLLWYLGSWFDPGDLQIKKFSSKVVSAKGYTQGLVWQIAGAHPMGYSNLQFGYWSRDPHDMNAPNGPNDPHDPNDPKMPALFSPAKS